MRRRFSCFVAALGLVLAGCSPATAPGETPTSAHTPDTGDPVVATALTLPPHYDPLDSDDPYSLRIAGLLQRGLFRFDAKGKAVPEVAESVETTDDRVYTVVLSQGWRFSNGEAVTADSFVDAWSRAADPHTPRLRRDLFAPIEGFVPSSDRPATPAATTTPSAPDGRSPRLRGLKVLDARTFTITLTHPRPDFVQRLGHVAFAPLPDVAFTDPETYRRTPVGNGPYRLEGTWKASGPVLLRPNPTYTGTEGARNAGLDFRVYTDPAVAVEDMRAGRLDLLDVLPAAALQDFRDTFGERTVNQPVGASSDIVFPTGVAPWTGSDGADRRRAVSTSIDREALAREVLGGTSAPATDLATPLIEGHSRDLCGDDCRLDPRAAKKTLSEAGGLPGGLTIAYATDTGAAATVEAVCADVVKNLQIACTPKPHATTVALREAVRSGAEPGPYLSRYQMDYPLLENFLLSRFLPGSPLNRSGFRDPAAAAALDRADRTATPERIARFQAAEARILESMPVVPLLDLNATAIHSDAVRDVHVDVFGSPDYAAVQRP